MSSDVLNEVDVAVEEEKKQTRTPKEESIPRYIRMVQSKGMGLDAIAHSLGVQPQSVKNLVESTEKKWAETAKAYRKEIARRESLFTDETYPVQNEGETDEEFAERLEKYESDVMENDEVIEQLTEYAEKLENTKLPRPKDWKSNGKRGRRAVSPVELCNIAIGVLESLESE